MFKVSVTPSSVQKMHSGCYGTTEVMPVTINGALFHPLRQSDVGGRAEDHMQQCHPRIDGPGC